MLTPEEIPHVRPAWTVPSETEWLVREVHVTRGMLLPPSVNPPDVAQLLKAGLIEAVEPASQQSLRDALFAWANSNAQLTGRIKELALTESDDADPTNTRRQAALSATVEAIRMVQAARAEVAGVYRDLHVEVPQGFDAGPST
ncbi:CLASP family protein [Kribbella sp. NBC_01245]|uniref:hypothetical protein n=1 Tax=Kribbella sp. NBC_01245 TaxID=2903578 RepID=UPI002E2DD9B6|nr:hypothetical protein [Kribbella sp. NBC_01245]